jgi:gliding motility-associated-like protein
MKPLLLFFLFITFTSFNQTDCLTIKSILVDACGSPEGPNEMVHLQIGENNLNIDDISIDWPANNFLGFCQNLTTASTVDYMNSTILSCGHFLEPENGILPADANVLIITSVDFDATSHNYAGLMDTIYVIFQCAGNTNGHFVNWQNDCNYASGFRTTTIQVASDCQLSATYNRCDLVNQTGTIGGTATERDGARVDFDENGNPTYLNEGCTIPFTPPYVTLEYGDGINADNGFICANETLYLTANISSTISNFFWESDNGDFETPTELTSLFTPTTGAGNYFVYFVFENNCTDQQRDSLEITISPLPTATITATTDVCLNATEPTITFTGGNGTAPYTFTYTINNGAQQTITSTGDVATILIPTNIVQNYTVSLIEIEGSGITSCSQAINETVNIVVNPSPIVIITGETEYCFNSSSLLDAGSSFTSYSWSTGATTQTINATQTDNPITVTVENEFQCFTESAPITVIEQEKIELNNFPPVCDGVLVMQGNEGVNTGSWSTLDDVEVEFESNDLNTTITYTEFGNIGIVYSEANCNDSDTTFLLFVEQPWTHVNDTVTCLGEAFILSASAVPQNENYIWNTGSSESGIIVNESGIYTVTVSNVCGSFSDQAQIDFILCDVDFPNVFTPNNDEVNDHFQLISHYGITNFSIVILNRWGNVVFESNQPDFKWNGSSKNDKHCSDGVYFYKANIETISGEEIEKTGFIHLLRNEQ